MTRPFVHATLAAVTVLLAIPASLSMAGPWAVPVIKLPPPGTPRPIIACTLEERDRLQAAYRSTGPEHDAVAGVVRQADRAITRPVEFPPRGGQHNQWYQCDKCQIALKTIDATHHQCPRCKTVYSGEPYDDVLYSHTHGRNLDNAAAAAWAYLLTGQDKYAAFAKSVLLGYAQRYRAYPYHASRPPFRGSKSRSGGHLFEQTLTEASCLAGTIAPAYDLIHDSPLLSPADQEAIQDGLIRPMLENIAKNKTGKNNWQTWHDAAMLWGGAVLGDASWVERAISDPENGFLYQMQVSVTDDGMWYENSWGYHFYTMSALVDLVEGSRRLGIDLWSHPALKKMFTVPAEYAMPDGSLPRFGDDTHSSIRSASSRMEFAYHAYGDPQMLPYLPQHATWDSVMLGRRVEEHAQPAPPAAKVFPGAGHAILRAGGDAGLAAAITFGPYGGFHGHYDKLSFVFFGYGRELGVDPGRARSQAYRLPVHSNWYKAALGHNAVLVDRQSQKPATGKLYSFAANDQYAAVVAGCDEAYPGVDQRRLLCLTPGYLLVVDDLVSASPRRFDWVYHNRGKAVECDVASDARHQDEPYTGWEYVENVRYGKTESPVRIQFSDDDVTTHLTMAASSGTEVRVGDGVGGSILDRVPLATITRKGQTARFAAVLEPVGDGRQPSVSLVSVDTTDGKIRILVRRGRATDAITFVERRAAVITVDGKTVLASQESIAP